MEKGADLRDEESAVAWIYRLLRNALVDRRRADAARGRALESRAKETADDGVEDTALRGEVCRCVVGLLPTLKPEYAEAHYNLGVFYELHRKDMPRALAQYRKYRELGGRDDRVERIVGSTFR